MAAPGQQRDDAADLILYNGDIHTMNPAQAHASAVAIRGDRIVAVGDSASAMAHGDGTRFIDLGGRSVSPGLVDAHCHLFGLGLDLQAVSVRGAASEGAAVDLVVAGAKTRPAGQWLLGRGWDQNRWPGQQFPTHASLDAKVSDRPVVLRRIDGHAIWVNSVALAAAGVSAATPDPPGGKIVHDAKGQPTGVFVDNAIAVVEDKVPQPDAATRRAWLLAAADKAVHAGITGVHEMGIDDDTAAVYRQLAEEHALPLRVNAYLAGNPNNLARLAQPPAADVGWFAMRGVKFYADGALGSRGARLYAPYDDDPGNSGLWVTEPAVLARAVDAAVAGGWQVATHAIGDAGVGSVIDAYLLAQQAHPGDHRLRVEHTQIIAPKDIDRMVQAHAIASMQPTHATSDMPWAEARIGKERVKGAYAWRTMLDHKIPLAGGSDFPVEEVGPLLGIYAAISRQDGDGKPDGGWYPEQKLTLDEALAMFTTGAAYAEHAEDHRGMIAPGYDADLTVFDGQLTAGRNLLTLTIAATIVGGRDVYVTEAMRGKVRSPFQSAR